MFLVVCDQGGLPIKLSSDYRPPNEMLNISLCSEHSILNKDGGRKGTNYIRIIRL